MRKTGPSVASAWLLVGLAGSLRIDADVDGVLLSDSSSAEVLPVMRSSSVSFEFMTVNLTYQKRPSSFWGWAKRSFFQGRRQFSDLKDEIVGGHACNNMRERDQTYYASSMCYWMPEVQTPFEGGSSEGPGVTWKTLGSSRQMCRAFTGSGQCLRCAVCHNNGRNKEGTAGWTARQDAIPLPEGCKKELEIERMCQHDHDGNNTALMGEEAICNTKQRAYEAAIRALNANHREQAELQSRIDAIPGQITSVGAQIESLRAQLLSLAPAVWNARNFGVSACYPFREESWYQLLTDSSVDAPSLLARWPTRGCNQPREPWCQPAECPNQWRDYEAQAQAYHECRNCQDAKQQTSDASDTLRDGEQTLASLEETRDGLPHEREAMRARLTEAQGEEQGLKDAVGDAEGAWLPIRSNCTNWQARYDASLAPWMRKHLPEYYGISCEKACHEKMSSAGCGVMEGAMLGELWDSVGSGANPGIDVECSPPSSSFVLAPTKYGALPETKAETCARLRSNPDQAPRRPHEVVLKGPLWKRERLWRRWQTRYFALESGDDVRSAVIRYWTSNPNQPNAVERWDKAITLWDARSVLPEPGTKYDLWGEECFRLKHYYREYILCTATGNSQAAALRDQWLSLIGAELKFPNAIPTLR